MHKLIPNKHIPDENKTDFNLCVLNVTAVHGHSHLGTPMQWHTNTQATFPKHPDNGYSTLLLHKMDSTRWKIHCMYLKDIKAPSDIVMQDKFKFSIGCVITLK